MEPRRRSAACRAVILTSSCDLLPRGPCRSFPPRPTPRSRSSQETAATGIRASLAAVLVSVGLGAVKIIAGVLGHSYALIADGVESMLDVVSGLMVAGSLKIAAQPPDEEYPFGYGKVEPAAAHDDCRRSAGRGDRHRHSKRARDSQARIRRRQAVYAGRARAGRRDQGSAFSLPVSHRRIDRQQGAARPTPGTIAAIRSRRWRRSSGFRSRWWAAKATNRPTIGRPCLRPAIIAFNGVRLFRKAWREIMDASLPESVVDDIRDDRPPRRRRGRHRHVPRAQERPRAVGRYPRRSATAT